MCMNAYGYSLESSLVQVARDEFYKHRHRRLHCATCRLSFDQIWERLAKDQSMEEISTAAGVHVTSLIRLYENHFMRFFGNQTGRERARTIWAKQHAAQVAQLAASLPEVPWIQCTAELARRAGLSVTPCLRTDQDGAVSVSTKFVSINGVRCLGHPITTAIRRSPQGQPFGALRFWRVRVEDTDCHVAPILLPGHEPTALVIPNEVVKTRIFEQTDRPYFEMLFPLRRTTLHGSARARLDVLPFVNAWDIIPQLQANNAQTALA